MSHMILTRTRHRTRLLADQAMSTMGDMGSAAMNISQLANTVPTDELRFAIQRFGNAADSYKYSAQRIGAAADDIALTVACVGVAVIVAVLFNAWTHR